MIKFDASFYDKKSKFQYELGLDLMKQMRINENERILDFGCGTGKLTLKLAKDNHTCKITGIDINKEMIDYANKNLKIQKLNNIAFKTMDILEEELSDKFDVIFSNSAVHWVKDKESLFRKFHSMLRTDGRIGIQIPSSKNLSDITPLFMYPIEYLKLHEYFKNWKYPMKRSSIKKLNKILDPIGYKEYNVFIKDRQLDFIDHQELLDFLKSAALVPILNSLPDEFKDKYCNSLLKLLKENGDKFLKITMKRIYMFLEN